LLLSGQWPLGDGMPPDVESAFLGILDDHAATALVPGPAPDPTMHTGSIVVTLTWDGQLAVIVTVAADGNAAVLSVTHSVAPLPCDPTWETIQVRGHEGCSLQMPGDAVSFLRWDEEGKGRQAEYRGLETSSVLTRLDGWLQVP
jgi:hypothetical protein